MTDRETLQLKKVIEHFFLCIKSKLSPSVHALPSLFALVAESSQKLTSVSLNILFSSHPSFNPFLPHRQDVPSFLFYSLPCMLGLLCARVSHII